MENTTDRIDNYKQLSEIYSAYAIFKGFSYHEHKSVAGDELIFYYWRDKSGNVGWHWDIVKMCKEEMINL